MNEKKPFHETIISAIERCPGSATEEILRLFQLIKETIISDNHNQIIAAIDEYFNFPDSSELAHDLRLVKKSIREQKNR